VPHGERLLLGPGPSNPYPEAVAALTRPVLGHLDPEFLALLDETMDRLRSVFRTKNALTLPISGTGSAGMEACFVNLLERGDTAIVGVNGYFGERLCEVARRIGAEVVRVETEGETRVARMLWATMLGDLVSLRLAEARGVDPVKVEAIDRFKSAMRAQPAGGRS